MTGTGSREPGAVPLDRQAGVVGEDGVQVRNDHHPGSVALSVVPQDVANVVRAYVGEADVAHRRGDERAALGLGKRGRRDPGNAALPLERAGVVRGDPVPGGGHVGAGEKGGDPAFHDRERNRRREGRQAHRGS